MAPSATRPVCTGAALTVTIVGRDVCAVDDRSVDTPSVDDRSVDTPTVDGRAVDTPLPPIVVGRG